MSRKVIIPELRDGCELEGVEYAKYFPKEIKLEDVAMYSAKVLFK